MNLFIEPDRKLEMCPWDMDAPRYCQIRINRELSLTKGNNSWRHDAIWAILKLEHIMVRNNVTKFLRITIKIVHVREQKSFQLMIFYKLREITP